MSDDDVNALRNHLRVFDAALLPKKKGLALLDRLEAAEALCRQYVDQYDSMLGSVASAKMETRKAEASLTAHERFVREVERIKVGDVTIGERLVPAREIESALATLEKETEK